MCKLNSIVTALHTTIIVCIQPCYHHKCPLVAIIFVRISDVVLSSPDIPAPQCESYHKPLCCFFRAPVVANQSAIFLEPHYLIKDSRVFHLPHLAQVFRVSVLASGTTTDPQRCQASFPTIAYTGKTPTDLISIADCTVEVGRLHGH